MIVLTLHLLQCLKISRLVFGRVVLDVPKLTLCLYGREVKVRELDFFKLNAAADVGTVLEGLA